MIKKLILLFFCLSLQESFSMPIPEQTLKALIENTPFIVEGYVIKIENKKISEDDYYSIAKIRILKIFKGSIKEDTIDLYFQPNMICPSPDVYEINEKVICFINNDFYRQFGGYNVPGLTYGKKNINSDIDRNIYEDKIIEYLKILKVKNEDKKNIKATEWLVQCAEIDLTRADAISDLLKNFDYEKNIKTIKYSDLLSSNQKERLYNCFISINHEYKHYDLALLNLIKGINDKIILLILKNKANQVSEPEVMNCNLYIYYIGMYLKKDFSSISKDLAKNLGTMRYNRKEDKERMKLVYTDFLKIINLEIN